MTEAIDITNRRELFVDDTLVERFQGEATLKMHPPQREDVVLQVEGPLENACSGVYSVLVQDKGRYMLYYRGHYPVKNESGDSSQQQTAHVAFSDDGLNFERPQLGIIDVDDNGRNNVIWQGIQAHNFVPFRDTNPVSPADRQFKAVGGTGKDNLYALFSADGIHWRLAQEEPLAIPGAFDSANIPIWDPMIGRYRLFSRYFDEAGRAIQSCESEDFINWSTPVPHQYEAGVPRHEFYTNATVLCPGAEHILLSFPMRYVRTRTTPLDDISAMDYPGNPDHPGMTGMTDAVMMSSRDGVHWKRPFLEAWLRAGLDDRNWTHRNTCPGIGILTHSDTEWWMYVSEHYGWPDNRLRRLSIRPWGFASVNGSYHGGGMTTKPVIFDGNELRLNFSTSAVGAIAVELQEQDGAPIPGFTLTDFTALYGDRLDQTVSWANGTDVSTLAGRPIRLHFKLADADVFAFRFC